MPVVKVLLNKHQTEIERELAALVQAHGMPKKLNVCEYGTSICVVAVWGAQEGIHVV